MGTIIPDPYNPPDVDDGTACSTCWGTGKTFGEILTPESIYCNFSGVNISEGWSPADGDPIDGVYKLDQLAGTPCEFDYLSPTLNIHLLFDTDGTFIDARNGDSELRFYSVTQDKCQIELYNEMGEIFSGGSCTLFIEEERV